MMDENAFYWSLGRREGSQNRNLSDPAAVLRNNLQRGLFSGVLRAIGTDSVEILKPSGELTALLLFLLQATQGVCCSPSASPVCPSCCSTSSIRLRSTASWQGTPSRLTSTVSAAFIVRAFIVTSASLLSLFKCRRLLNPTPADSCQHFGSGGFFERNARFFFLLKLCKLMPFASDMKMFLKNVVVCTGLYQQAVFFFLSKCKRLSGWDFFLHSLSGTR